MISRKKIDSFLPGDMISVHPKKILAVVCRESHPNGFSLLARMFRGDLGVVLGYHPESTDYINIVLSNTGVSGWVQIHDIAKV